MARPIRRGARAVPARAPAARERATPRRTWAGRSANTIIPASLRGAPLAGLPEPRAAAHEALEIAEGIASRYSTASGRCRAGAWRTWRPELRGGSANCERGASRSSASTRSRASTRCSCSAGRAQALVALGDAAAAVPLAREAVALAAAQPSYSSGVPTPAARSPQALLAQRRCRRARGDRSGARAGLRVARRVRRRGDAPARARGARGAGRRPRRRRRARPRSRRSPASLPRDGRGGPRRAPRRRRLNVGFEHGRSGQPSRVPIARPLRRPPCRPIWLRSARPVPSTHADVCRGSASTTRASRPPVAHVAARNARTPCHGSVDPERTPTCS